MAITLKDCPLCKHPMAQHDPRGACKVKDCWCLFDPNQEFGEH